MIRKMRHMVGIQIIVLLVAFFAVSAVYAQQERNVGGSPVADQDRNQAQDQDQTQTNKPEEAGSSTSAGVSDVPREQQQEMSRVQKQDPASTSGQQIGGDDALREQAREQEHVQSPEELRQYVQERTQAQVQQSGEASDEAVHLRNRAQIAVQAIQAAENMLGQNGPRMSAVAEEANQAAQGMAQREEALEKRSWLRAFFFGQDQEQAQALQEEAEQNRVRIQEMNQLLTSCDDCDGEVRTLLQEQVQTMLQEQDRLDQVAEKAVGRWGLLGWLFGN
jgi:hypothetical protein